MLGNIFIYRQDITEFDEGVPIHTQPILVDVAVSNQSIPDLIQGPYSPTGLILFQNKKCKNMPK